MNTKEFIEKIKAIAVKFLEDTPPPAPVELMEATTTDNQVLKAASWEVGQDITLVGVDGETPAPDGSYDLTGEPAKTIVVKDGKIADVIEVVASVDPAMPDAEFRAEMEKQWKEWESKQLAKMAAIESANALLIADNKKLSEGMQGLLTALSEMEQPAPTPAPSPTQPKKHWEKFIPQN